MKIITKFNLFVNEGVKINKLDIEQEDLNTILKGYLVAVLFTEEERLEDEYKQNITDKITDSDEDDDDIEKLIKRKKKNNVEKTFTIEDFDIDSKIKAYNDIKKFISKLSEDEYNDAIDSEGLEQFGYDLWLSRNGHGAGFFDRDYDSADILQNKAREMKEVYVYIGDNGKIHL